MTRAVFAVSFAVSVAGTALAAVALTACASSPCGVVSGPALASPGPAIPQFATAWHRDALGEEPRWVQANRPTRHMLGFRCGGGASGYFPKLDDYDNGWAQADTFDGERGENAREQPVVCVFHPFPNAVPVHELRSPRRLPSGTLEGDLWEDGKKQSNGAVFLLEGGVFVVARGNAAPRVRAIVSRSATPPPPLPMASDVQQWTYAGSVGRTLSWLLYNGARLELRFFQSEVEAERDLASRQPSIGNGDGGKRAWVHGTNVYVFRP